MTFDAKWPNGLAEWIITRMLPKKEDVSMYDVTAITDTLRRECARAFLLQHWPHDSPELPEPHWHVYRADELAAGFVPADVAARLAGQRVVITVEIEDCPDEPLPAMPTIVVVTDERGHAGLYVNGLHHATVGEMVTRHDILAAVGDVGCEPIPVTDVYTGSVVDTWPERLPAEWAATSGNLYYVKGPRT